MRSAFRVSLFAVLTAAFFIFAATPVHAITAPAPEATVVDKPDVDRTKASSDADAKKKINFPELAKEFRRHCVRVFIHAKTDQGAAPEVGDYAEDIKHERPTPIGGYWWDGNHVVIQDDVLHDRFIRSIEIGLPDSDKVYPARIAGRFKKLRAVLLEVTPNADGEKPEGRPFAFEDGDTEDAYSFSYSLAGDGGWRIGATAGISGATLADDDELFVKFSAPGVLTTKDGVPLGLAFGSEAFLDSTPDAPGFWFGTGLRDTPLISTEKASELREDLRERLSRAVLETRFRIRMNIDEGEEDDVMQWADEMDDSQLRDGSAEVRSAAFVVGARHLFAPVPLPPEGIARIESITVAMPDGTEKTGRFAGAFRDYLAVLVEVDGGLPTDGIPSGFGRLNPLLDELDDPNGIDAKAGASKAERLGAFQRWLVDYSLGRRRERVDYDRWLGGFRGYRGDAIVSTCTNEENGSLAFDEGGNLIAVSLTPRLIRSRDRSSNAVTKASAGFRPVDFLAERFGSADVFDPALTPVEEEEGQRLIDLGVEYQGLDANTARLFNASHATRGGKIGLLVTHVYAGSIADGLGIREKDVLLRLFVEGRREPMELKTLAINFSGVYDMDMSPESFRNLIRYMPPPWPNRENLISTLLTAAGVGREATVEYLRDGEVRRGTFTTAYFEPDYRSARKTRFRGLGLTVKPITYEVARYFSRGDNSGVIISRVEMGSKAAVAGLHHFLLITRVDGQRIEGVEDFRAKVEPFEEGNVSAIELTTEGFGKTRLVKIE